MPGCYITGTAAGIAASMTSKKRSVRSIDIDRLKEAIRADFGKDTI